MTPLLRKLYRLSVPERVEFKLLQSTDVFSLGPV